MQHERAKSATEHTFDRKHLSTCESDIFASPIYSIACANSQMEGIHSRLRNNDWRKLHERSYDSYATAERLRFVRTFPGITFLGRKSFALVALIEHAAGPEGDGHVRGRTMVARGSHDRPRYLLSHRSARPEIRWILVVIPTRRPRLDATIATLSGLMRSSSYRPPFTATMRHPNTTVRRRRALPINSSASSRGIRGAASSYGRCIGETRATGAG